MAEKSRLRRSISRWASTDDQHARDMRKEYGTLRTVTLRPRGGVPALEAELYDGTGTITVIWLGRRRISGVNPGRSLEIRGRIGRHDGQRIMYNPRYELMP
jgi:hypothetical protein